MLPSSVGMGAVSPIPEERPGPGIHPRASADRAPRITLSSLRPVVWSVKQYGLDTMVYGFKPTSSEARQALRRPVSVKDDLAALTGRPCTIDESGRPLPVSVTDKGNWTARFGWATVLGFPEFDLVRVEFRPAALLARDERVSGLLDPA